MICHPALSSAAAAALDGTKQGLTAVVTPFQFLPKGTCCIKPTCVYACVFVYICAHVCMCVTQIKAIDEANTCLEVLQSVSPYDAFMVASFQWCQKNKTACVPVAFQLGQPPSLPTSWHEPAGRLWSPCWSQT